VQVSGGVPEKLLELAQRLPPLLLVLLLLIRDELVHKVGQDGGDGLQDHHRRYGVRILLVP
jgi:hypothetical protein